MMNEPGVRNQLADGPTKADASDEPTVDSPRRIAQQPGSPPAIELPKAIGRYAVQRVLGSGAFGSVYLAHDSELNRLVALKVPRADRFTGPEQVEQFIAEARTAAQLKHPRIVGVHDIARQPDGMPVVVLDYIDGHTLKSLLESSKLSPRRTAELMIEIADAVAVAHQKGFVHRDLKPANILLDSAGKPHIADFGLALHEDAQREHSGEFAGTIAYMAPEQVRGESHRLDGRADIWALGVTLYQMLTGRLPFGGNSSKQLSDEIQNRDPKPPRQIDASLPIALEAIISKCCAKRISDRYSTAKDVAYDLRSWLASLDRPSPDRSLMPTPVAPPAPSPALSINASCGAVSLALTATFSLLGLTVWGLYSRMNSNNRFGDVAMALPPDTWSKPGAAAQLEDDYSLSPPSSAEQSSRAWLRVKSIEVTHYTRSPAGDVLQGIVGRDSFSAKLGDTVQVTARLAKPGYAYLIVFRPDALPVLCFPETEDIPPPITDTPSYSTPNRLEAYELTEGAGLWAFAVIASNNPLPPYKEVKEQIQRNATWRTVGDLPPATVWWDDGANRIDQLTPTGAGNPTRGKGTTLIGPAEAIVQLTDALRTIGQPDCTAALAFAVTLKD